jgi:uncharacterized protein with PQ loop repeat
MYEYIIFVIGISAIFFSLWSTVPQIKKSLKTKKTDNVSKWLWISLIVGLSLWVLYGIMKGGYSHRSSKCHWCYFKPNPFVSQAEI